MEKLKISKNVPLDDLTTFKIGGDAKYLAEVKNKDELLSARDFAIENSLPIFVLGGGGDILISDKGFNGLVIRYVGDQVIFKDKKENVLVTAEAGCNWDDLVRKTVQKNLQGIECLSGIPGTVGAAPIQNIGAYGQELKDVFVRLDAYDFIKGSFVEFDRVSCKFAYRESVFKGPKNKGRFLIFNTTVRLVKGSPPTLTYESLTSYLEKKRISKPSLSQVRNAVLTIRGQKLDDPSVIGNAGSFFKNPIVEKKVLRLLQRKYPEIAHYPVNAGKVKLFAGWLVEDAGWKGKRHKNARVSEKHALVITNPEGKATAQEIKELAGKISDDVYKKFRVRLEQEVQFIGFD
jgi:UDP-N-acetylmuramate dehydrogenase